MAATETAEAMAARVGGWLCSLVGGCSVGVSGETAIRLSSSAQAAADGAGSFVDDVGDAGTSILDAAGRPAEAVADTARWVTIGVIAIVVVVLVLIALFVFFYLRGFR